MKEFIRNNRFTLIGLAFGLIIAFFFYSNNSKSIRYRVVFQYSTAKSDLLPPTLKTDTFFIYNSIPIRTYENSFSDTLLLQGIKRSELLVYCPDKINLSTLNESLVKPLISNKGTIIFTRNEGYKENTKRFLVIPLLGVYLGYLLNVLIFKLTAKKKIKTTPI